MAQDGSEYNQTAILNADYTLNPEKLAEVVSQLRTSRYLSP